MNHNHHYWVGGLCITRPTWKYRKRKNQKSKLDSNSTLNKQQQTNRFQHQQKHNSSTTPTPTIPILDNTYRLPPHPPSWFVAGRHCKASYKRSYSNTPNSPNTVTLNQTTDDNIQPTVDNSPLPTHGDTPTHHELRQNNTPPHTRYTSENSTSHKLNLR